MIVVALRKWECLVPCVCSYSVISIPAQSHPHTHSNAIKRQVSELLEKTGKELGCKVELAGFIKYRTGEE